MRNVRKSATYLSVVIAATVLALLASRSALKLKAQYGIRRIPLPSASKFTIRTEHSLAARSGLLVSAATRQG